AEVVSGRVKNASVVKPIVYGNSARFLGRKRDEDGHTHEWTVYIRPAVNDCMSAYVRHVQFKLHESYANPVRTVTEPPYELTETGWGEFELSIRLVWHDPAEKPVTLFHLLKLFDQRNPDVTTGRTALTVELYDELVFNEPTKATYDLLTAPRLCRSDRHWGSAVGVDYAAKKLRDLEMVRSGRRELKAELDLLKDVIRKRRDAADRLKAMVARLEGAASAAAGAD
ncbi:hypothetical protein BOX15_Mlig025434g3, partial [Macrostomum lignano]